MGYTIVPLSEGSYLPGILWDRVVSLGLFCCSFPSLPQSWEATHPKTKDQERHFETNVIASEMWGIGQTHVQSQLLSELHPVECVQQQCAQSSPLHQCQMQSSHCLHFYGMDCYLV